MRSMVEGAATGQRLSLAPTTAFGGPPPPRRGGGAGSFGDHPQGAIETVIIEDVCRSEPEDFDSTFIQPCIPASVVRGSLGEVMRGAVDFNGQLGRSTIEIESVGTYRMLPAESQSVQSAAAETIPEHDFWQAHIAPQSAGSLEGQDRRPQYLPRLLQSRTKSRYAPSFAASGTRRIIEGCTVRRRRKPRGSVLICPRSESTRTVRP